METLKAAVTLGDCQDTEACHIESIKDMLGTDRIFK